MTDEATREKKTQRRRRAQLQSAKNGADRLRPGVVSVLFHPGLVSEEQVIEGKNSGDPLTEPGADVAPDAQEPLGQIDVAALGAPPAVRGGVEGVSRPSLPALPVDGSLEKGPLEGLESFGVPRLRKRGGAVGRKVEYGCPEVRAERGRIQREGAVVRMAPGDGEGEAWPGLPRPDGMLPDNAALAARRCPRAGRWHRRLEDAGDSREIFGGDEKPACARPDFLRQFWESLNGAKSFQNCDGAVWFGACGSPKLQASFLSGTVLGNARHGRPRTGRGATGSGRLELKPPQ